MAKKNETTATDAVVVVSLDVPSVREFTEMRAALLDQLDDEALVGSWWRRVKKHRRDENWSALKLAYAEACNRLDHSKRKKGEAILRVLFKLLGVVLP